MKAVLNKITRKMQAILYTQVDGFLIGKPDDIRVHFREKEDLIAAWFDRTDSQMQKASETMGFLALSPRKCLHPLIMAWHGGTYRLARG